VLDEITYDSFGNVLSETNPAAGDRFKFTARELDAALSLYYYRARSYDPQAGRFLREDPLSFTAGDTNLYRYVFNIPVSVTDPSGMWSWSGAFSGFISGILVGAPVGAGAGTWIFGIGAIPGAVAGGIVGGITGFIGGGIWGEDVGRATGTNPAVGGAVVGCVAGVVGGIVGPLGYSLYTGLFWISPLAEWLGISTAGAAITQLQRQKEFLEWERQFWKDQANNMRNDPAFRELARQTMLAIEEDIREIEELIRQLGGSP
jgi:RHS repeat-associated protein